MTLWRSFYIDKASGEPSSSKFWQNFGLLILCVGVLIAAANGSFNELVILAFGFVVCGNRAAQMIIERVLGKTQEAGSGQSQ
jgi:hypothetical protein